MQLVSGSPLSETQLWARAAHMLREYGDGARDEVNRRIDRTNATGDFQGHATWVNVSLCLIALTVKGEGEASH